LEPSINALGFELVQLENIGKGTTKTLRLFIDQLSEDRTVGVDDCALVSRHVSALLDAEDPIPGHYVLEVSSPGIERPLVKPEHFARYQGELASVRTHGHHLGRRRFVGQLHGLDGDKVLIEVDGEIYALPMDDIDKANLKFADSAGR
jgi:ribosome maturation factor RimP